MARRKTTIINDSAPELKKSSKQLIKAAESLNKEVIKSQESTQELLKSAREDFIEQTKHQYTTLSEMFKTIIRNNDRYGTELGKELGGVMASTVASVASVGKGIVNIFSGKGTLAKQLAEVNKKIASDKLKFTIKTDDIKNQISDSQKIVFDKYKDNITQMLEEMKQSITSKVSSGQISKKNYKEEIQKVQNIYSEKINEALSESILSQMSDINKGTLSEISKTKKDAEQTSLKIKQQMEKDFEELQENYKKMGIILSSDITEKIQKNIEDQTNKIKQMNPEELKANFGNQEATKSFLGQSKTSMVNLSTQSGSLNDVSKQATAAVGTSIMGALASAFSIKTIGKVLGPLIKKGMGTFLKGAGIAGLIVLIFDLFYKYALGGGMGDMVKKTVEDYGKMNTARMAKDIQTLTGNLGSLSQDFVKHASLQFKLMTNVVEQDSDILIGMESEHREEFFKSVAETGMNMNELAKYNNDYIQNVRKDLKEIGGDSQSSFRNDIKATMGTFEAVGQSVGVSAGEIFKDTRKMAVDSNKSQMFLLEQNALVKDIWETNRDSLEIDFGDFKDVISNTTENLLGFSAPISQNAKAFKGLSETVKTGKKFLKDFYQGLQSFFDRGSAQEKLKWGLLAAKNISTEDRAKLVSADVLRQLTSVSYGTMEEASKQGGITKDTLTQLEAVYQTQGSKGLQSALSTLQSQYPSLSMENLALIGQASQAVTGNQLQFASYLQTAGPELKQLAATRAGQNFQGAQTGLGGMFDAQLLSDMGIGDAKTLYAMKYMNQEGKDKMMQDALAMPSQILQSGSMAVDKSIKDISAVNAASTNEYERFKNSLQGTVASADDVAKSFIALGNSTKNVSSAFDSLAKSGPDIKKVYMDASGL